MLQEESRPDLSLRERKDNRKITKKPKHNGEHIESREREIRDR